MNSLSRSFAPPGPEQALKSRSRFLRLQPWTREEMLSRTVQVQFYFASPGRFGRMWRWRTALPDMSERHANSLSRSFAPQSGPEQALKSKSRFLRLQPWTQEKMLSRTVQVKFCFASPGRFGRMWRWRTALPDMSERRMRILCHDLLLRNPDLSRP